MYGGGKSGMGSSKPMSKKSKSKPTGDKKTLTKRQMDALARHKKDHGHSKAHMDMMKKLMMEGKSFSEAHKMTMKKLGK